MPLTLYVDGDRWRGHLRGVIEREPGLVPVAKGNGYGFGLGRLARRATWLERDTIAVGTYAEVAEVEKRFPGSVLVLSPWRPTVATPLTDRMVHTVGRLEDLHDLQARGASEGVRPRIVLELVTSMLRHGFTAAGLREAGTALTGCHLEGVALLRPLLGVRRATTRAACEAEHLVPWDDPQNADPRFARVRVRERVLPVLEAELGPGIAEALARTAAQLREDAEAFDEMIDETIEDIVEHAEAGISVSVAALAANPAALRHRIIRHVVAAEFGASLTRAQTLEVARLVTDWSGQGPIDLPDCSAVRQGGRIVFTASGR